MGARGSRSRKFHDRREAGRALAERLVARYGDDEGIVVLALPRGGVPIAAEVAHALRAPLDVLTVRKLGAPFNPEYAIGAIASGGSVVYHERMIEALGMCETDVEEIVAREHAELIRRERLYRGGRAPLALEGKTVILVDDGMATGATMEAAVRSARQASALRVVAAAPTASQDAVDVLSHTADAVEVLDVPEPYHSVGCWYLNFPQLRDEEVIALLDTAELEAAVTLRGERPP
jgi:putative phosphoribosyl transferase